MTARKPEAPMGPVVLRRSAAMAYTGLSFSQFREFVKGGKFPAPIYTGRRTTMWLKSECDEWLAKRAAERERETAKYAAANEKTQAKRRATLKAKRGEQARART
jgi:predicted DNA-binding transcriptional regulator AlpA